MGESIVVHVGGGKWVIVDSCRNQDGSVAPLTYLHGIGVDVARDVLLVVGTHAHDDHISGLADVFAQCCRARFVCSQALTKEEFVALTAQEDLFSDLLRESSYAEYSRILKLADEPNRRSAGGIKPLVRAIAGRPVMDAEISPVGRVVVLPVSPSDEAVTRSLRVLATARARPDNSRGLRRIDPNELAVALWLKVGEKRILLGADLLVGPQGCGWIAVLATFIPDAKASLFKVPHHGAPNAHHDGVWDALLQPAPLALVAPYRAGRNRRPSESDRARIRSRTPHAYVTAPTRPPLPPRPTMAALSSIATNVRLANAMTGQVRARSQVGDERWDIAMTSPALRL